MSSTFFYDYERFVWFFVSGRFIKYHSERLWQDGKAKTNDIHNFKIANSAKPQPSSCKSWLR